MLKEFKAFAMKGNLVDIAVAFVMGAAFNNVVTKFTGGIVSPIIGLLFDTDFNELKYVMKEGEVNDAGEVIGEIALLYGEFITAVLDFIIVAFVMFLIVKGINNMKKKEADAAPPAPSNEEVLLAQIRDLLSKQQ
ncbi:MAG: large conductance mechanosensitive channel protein MscL [Bacteroidota bacterium]